MRQFVQDEDVLDRVAVDQLRKEVSAARELIESTLRGCASSMRTAERKLDVVNFVAQKEKKEEKKGAPKRDEDDYAPADAHLAAYSKWVTEADAVPDEVPLTNPAPLRQRSEARRDSRLAKWRDPKDNPPPATAPPPRRSSNDPFERWQKRKVEQERLLLHGWQAQQLDVHFHSRLDNNEMLSSMEHSYTKCKQSAQEPNTCFARMVRSAWFNGFAMTLIMVNCLWSAANTDRHIRAISDGKDFDDSHLAVVEDSFTLIFAIEVVLRLSAMRLWFFLGKERMWNLFDGTLVAVSVFDFVAGGRVFHSKLFLRIIRMARTMKMLRAMRLFRFFRQLRIMMASILGTLVTLFWLFALLCMVIFVFSLFFLQAVISHVEEKLDNNESPHPGFKLHYSSLPDTMWSLFLSISGGLDWSDVQRPLSDISVAYTLLFGFFVIFTTFGVMNVVIGMFVAAASENIDKQILTQEHLVRKRQFLKDMFQLFKEFGAEEDGELTFEQFRDKMEMDEVRATFALHELDCEDAHLIFHLLDPENVGRINMQKFISGCYRLKGTARGMEMYLIREQMTDMFSLLCEMQERTDVRLQEMQMEMTVVGRNPMYCSL